MRNKVNWITEYKVLHASDAESLTKKVNGLIPDGWQPFGHPGYIHNGRATKFIQAMTKDKD